MLLVVFVRLFGFGDLAYTRAAKRQQDTRKLPYGAYYKSHRRASKVANRLRRARS